MKKAQRGNCGGEARIVRGDYEFKETGLRDLILLDIELISEPRGVRQAAPREQDDALEVGK